MKKLESPSADQLIAKRKAVGWSQSFSAKLVGCSLRSWQNWEAGVHIMSPGLWKLYLAEVEAVTNGNGCS